MLSIIIIFLILSAITGSFLLSGVLVAFAGIVKILFIVFLFLFLVSGIHHLFFGHRK